MIDCDIDPELRDARQEGEAQFIVYQRRFGPPPIIQGVNLRGLLSVVKLDPRLAPAYSVGQAAHDLKIPEPTARSWVLGRDYPVAALPTAVIVDRINAGADKTALAKDYGATEEEIMDALACERAA